MFFHFIRKERSKTQKKKLFLKKKLYSIQKYFWNKRKENNVMFPICSLTDLCLIVWFSSVTLTSAIPTSADIRRRRRKKKHAKFVSVSRRKAVKKGKADGFQKFFAFLQTQFRASKIVRHEKPFAFVYTYTSISLSYSYFLSFLDVFGSLLFLA